MDMTEILYYQDANLREFEATVTAVESGDQMRWPWIARPSTPAAAGSPTTWAGWPAARRCPWSRHGGRAIWHSWPAPDTGGAAAGHSRTRPARLGAALRAHAHPHRHAHPVRRGLARLRRPGHRRQHGAARGAHGLRVRHPQRGSWWRDRGPTATPRSPPPGMCTSRILPREEAFQIPDLIRTKINLLPEGIRRSAPWRSWAWTCRPTAGPTWATPARSGDRGGGLQEQGAINKRIYIRLS